METVKLFWKAECLQCSSAKVTGNQLREEGSLKKRIIWSNWIPIGAIPKF